MCGWSEPLPAVSRCAVVAHGPIRRVCGRSLQPSRLTVRQSAQALHNVISPVGERRIAECERADFGLVSCPMLDPDIETVVPIAVGNLCDGPHRRPRELLVDVPVIEEVALADDEDAAAGEHEVALQLPPTAGLS